MHFDTTRSDRHLRALCTSRQREQLLHRGSENEGLSVETVVLPTGWEISRGYVGPDTVIDVGWHRYHMLRVVEVSNEAMVVSMDAFPEPEYYKVFVPVPCHRYGRRQYKNKVKRGTRHENVFTLLYVYLLMDEEVESEYLNWWE